MATLVLTSVGRLLGGRVGGAIGAFVGQQIDNRLFGAKPREGARLDDLSVQTSTYGSSLPRLYGTVRVAGTVIWATDLRETRRKVSAGKGRPKQTVYSYSADFAVALSSRPITAIGRIWADGNLLRGEGGDFKVQTGFRFHMGDDDQHADPLIAAIEGVAAPAYRGLAYVVFEGLQLEEFGNRIPSLSFEVIADPGDVAVSAIIVDSSTGIVAAAGGPSVAGVALAGDDLGQALAGLADAAGLIVAERQGQLIARQTPIDAGAIDPDQLGAATGREDVPRLDRARDAIDTVPGRYSLAYYDVARDHQPGLQTVLRPGLGNGERRLDLPISLDPAAAKSLIARKLERDVARRETARISLPFGQMRIEPGDRLSLPGVAGWWIVDDARLEGMLVRLSLSRLAEAQLSATPADSGRVLSSPDRTHGPTVLHLLDLPWLSDGVAVSPAVFAVAAGPSPAWRSASLLQSNDGGVSYQEIGATAAPATLGTAMTLLAAGASATFDRRNSVEVELLHDEMALHSVSSDALIAEHNIALLGHELIQFERADQISPTRYRLSGLLRGRRATEWAMGTHAIGERFVMIDRDDLLAIEAPVGVASLIVQAQGLGDPAAVSASVTMPMAALLPSSPVHLSYQPMANGDTVMGWCRRSRDGWRWLDHVDAPLAESAERYALLVAPNAGPARDDAASEPSWIYTAAARAADIAAGATAVTVSVRQIGTHGVSRAAQLAFSLS